MASKKNTVVICGHDPGTKSYGFSIIEVQLSAPLTKEERRPKNNKVPLKRLPFKILHHRKVQNTFTELKHPGVIAEETAAYINEIAGACREYEVDFIIAERYQSRRMGGTTIELVNMMLGSLRGIALAVGAPLKVMPASQWKVPLGHQEFELEALYKRAKEFKVSDHEIDATFIALYGAFTLMRRKPFFMDDVQELGETVLKQLQLLRRQGTPT